MTYHEFHIIPPEQLTIAELTLLVTLIEQEQWEDEAMKWHYIQDLKYELLSRETHCKSCNTRGYHNEDGICSYCDSYDPTPF